MQIYHTRKDEKMKLASKIEQTREIVLFWKKQGFSVGLVPTMGYLHEGRESLIKRAVKENDKVVVSIFVNPMQFGPKEDFASYPRDIKKDMKICEQAGANLIFHHDEEMYPGKFHTFVEVTELTAGLCARSRPVHFRGVCTVVSKLFHIVNPDRAYFGQKDAQQLAVISKMVQDLNMDIQIIGCPIIREADGLAKSSRNTYLCQEERKAATILYESLSAARRELQLGNKDAAEISAIIAQSISTQPLAKIDYIEVVDWCSLKPVTVIDKPVLVAIAVYIGKTRLIDNFIFDYNLEKEK